MTRFSLGNQVPDWELIRPTGERVRLSELADRPVVLILLRHLA